MSINSLLSFEFSQRVGFTFFDEGKISIIENELRKKLVKTIIKSNMQIDFDVAFFDQMSWSLMTPINKGRISLIRQQNQTIIRYQFDIKRFVIIGTLFSLLLGILSMSIAYFILIFGLMVVNQALMARYRHDSFFDDLIKKLNVLDH